MRKLVRHLLAWCLLTGAAAVHGQAVTAAAPDVGAGKKRAAACFACHGADGISRIPGTPHLAGQERAYLESALRGYRDGQQRQNPTMNAMAKPLSDRDISNVAAYFSLLARMGNGQTAVQALETIDRIRPLGITTLAVVGSAAPPVAAAGTGTGASSGAARSGEAVYGTACVACHGSGAAGAPKLGDRPAWTPRLAQGQGTLLQHALQGYKAMPPRGGCADCSDADIQAAVKYLADKAS
jgi:cytochrome c5